jgi:hypothetical protein
MGSNEIKLSFVIRVACQPYDTTMNDLSSFFFLVCYFHILYLLEIPE